MEKANVKPGHPTNAKKKATVLEKAKKANEKANVIEQLKKAKEKAKKGHEKSNAFFFGLFFRIKMQKKQVKQKKSKSFFAFFVAFLLLFVFAFFAFFLKPDFLQRILDCFFIVFLHFFFKRLTF